MVDEFRNAFLIGLPKGIGTHAEGCSQLLDTVNIFRDTSIQVFLTPFRGSFPKYDTKKIREDAKRRNLTLFSHLPYFINLCSPGTKMFPDPIVSLNSVIRELKVASDMSFHGCVIHVGKNTKKMELEEAINEMKYSSILTLTQKVIREKRSNKKSILVVALFR